MRNYYLVTATRSQTHCIYQISCTTTDSLDITSEYEFTLAGFSSSAVPVQAALMRAFEYERQVNPNNTNSVLYQYNPGENVYTKGIYLRRLGYESITCTAQHCIVSGIKAHEQDDKGYLFQVGGKWVVVPDAYAEPMPYSPYKAPAVLIPPQFQVYAQGVMGQANYMPRKKLLLELIGGLVFMVIICIINFYINQLSGQSSIWAVAKDIADALVNVTFPEDSAAHGITIINSATEVQCITMTDDIVQLRVLESQPSWPMTIFANNHPVGFQRLNDTWVSTLQNVLNLTIPANVTMRNSTYIFPVTAEHKLVVGDYAKYLLALGLSFLMVQIPVPLVQRRLYQNCSWFQLEKYRRSGSIVLVAVGLLIINLALVLNPVLPEGAIVNASGKIMTTDQFNQLMTKIAAVIKQPWFSMLMLANIMSSGMLYMRYVCRVSSYQKIRFLNLLVVSLVSGALINAAHVLMFDNAESSLILQICLGAMALLFGSFGLQSGFVPLNVEQVRAEKKLPVDIANSNYVMFCKPNNPAALRMVRHGAYLSRPNKKGAGSGLMDFRVLELLTPRADTPRTPGSVKSDYGDPGARL